MRFSPSPTEQAVLESLPLEERFRYAITRICECEEVWSLGDDRGWLIREIDDRQAIAIWPYRRMAEEYQLEEWANNEPVCVSLEHFLCIGSQAYSERSHFG